MIILNIIILNLSLYLLLTITIGAYSQNCPNNAAHPKNNSEEVLTAYISSNSFDTVRSIFNLPSFQNAHIELLTGSSYSCDELNSRSLDFVNIHPNERYTYYKVSDYYFIVKLFVIDKTSPTNIIIYNNQYNLIHSALL